MNNISIPATIAASLYPGLESRRLAAARTLGEQVGLSLVLVSITTSRAFAAGGNTDPATVLTAILNIITGTMGTALAALGIIVCGLSWMFGRASVGTITGVVGGIMIVFGASFIAKQLVGGG